MLVLSIADTDATAPAADAAAEKRTPLISDLKLLNLFRVRMAERSVPINVARMMYDQTYAFHHIAIAHSSEIPLLQRLALHLFSQYPKPDDAHN